MRLYSLDSDSSGKNSSIHLLNNLGLFYLFFIAYIELSYMYVSKIIIVLLFTDNLIQ